VSSKRWLILFGLLALVILVILNWGYRLALQSLKSDLDNRLSTQLLNLADDIAVQIDPEMVSGEITVDGYVTLYEQIEEYKRLHGLADVRLLDTTFTDLLRETTDSLTVAVVSRLDYPTFLAAVSGFSAVSETYQWDHGYYKSAFAPIFDITGKVVAVIRVEADAGFFEVLEVFERGLWFSHVLSALFVVVVGGLFFWFFRRQAAWERQLLLSEKLLAMGRMASVIAHEIRNPLGIIKATAQRLGRVEQEKQKELLDYIPEEIDRLDGILTGYLQFADIRVQKSTVDRLSEVVRTSIQRTQKYCKEKEITVQGCPGEDVRVLADAEALGRAIENLIRNAADASPRGAMIEIDCVEKADIVHLTVADRGEGVPQKDRKRIFEPFHTTRAQGSGLGLYAARNSLVKMGGGLSYRPREGGGSVFIIDLPKARPGENS
jgi:signal transduction histidine kinase